MVNTLNISSLNNITEMNLSLQISMYRTVVLKFTVYDNSHWHSGHSVYTHVTAIKLQHLSTSVARTLLILQHFTILAVCCENKKPKKCQPAVRDTSRGGPHTANTGVGVPDSGLTRPTQKNIRTKKLKNKEEMTNITLANNGKPTKLFNFLVNNNIHWQSGLILCLLISTLKLMMSQHSRILLILQQLSALAVCCVKFLLILQHLSVHAVSPETTKTTKCQPAIRDTFRGGPHTACAGVGVPDSGLTRPKQKNIGTKKLKKPG